MSEQDKMPEQLAVEEANRTSVSKMLDQMIKGVGDSGKTIDLTDDNLPTEVEGDHEQEATAKAGEEEPEVRDEEGEEELSGEESEEGEEEEVKEVEEVEEKEARPLKGKESEVELLRREVIETRRQMDQMLQSGRFVKAPDDSIGGDRDQRKELQVLDFIRNDEEYESAISSRDSLNRLMNRVYYTALQETQRAVPIVAQAVVEQTFQLQAMAKDFFEKNRDLLPYRRFVGSVVNEVYAENPSKDPVKVLDEAATRARKSLRLKVQQKKEMRRSKGAKVSAGANFTPTQGSRPPIKSDTRTKLQIELDEM